MIIDIPNAIKMMGGISARNEGPVVIIGSSGVFSHVHV